MIHLLWNKIPFKIGVHENLENSIHHLGTNSIVNDKGVSTIHHPYFTAKKLITCSKGWDTSILQGYLLAVVTFFYNNYREFQLISLFMSLKKIENIVRMTIADSFNKNINVYSGLKMYLHSLSNYPSKRNELLDINFIFESSWSRHYDIHLILGKIKNCLIRIIQKN